MTQKQVKKGRSFIAIALLMAITPLLLATFFHRHTEPLTSQIVYSQDGYNSHVIKTDVDSIFCCPICHFITSPFTKVIITVHAFTAAFIFVKRIIFSTQETPSKSLYYSLRAPPYLLGA